METKIESMNDIRGAVAILTAKVYEMCNAKSVEDVNSAMADAKDLLIATYKFNYKRCGGINIPKKD